MEIPRRLASHEMTLKSTRGPTRGTSPARGNLNQPLHRQGAHRQGVTADSNGWAVAAGGGGGAVRRLIGGRVTGVRFRFGKGMDLNF